MAFTAATPTASSSPDLGKPQWSSHTWVEPLIVVGIMIGSLVVNRRRNYSIIPKARPDPSSPRRYHSPDPLLGSIDDDDDDYPVQHDSKRLRKSRNCCGFAVETPNSSRFANHIHSRILQKFPFLVEMFYWVLNYLAYRFTKDISALVSNGGNEVTQLAQDHGISILNLEHHSFLAPLFLEEVKVQGFFLQHPTALTFLNRIYSLVHIPGTVLFLSWFYYAARNHATFAIARRTMTLGNFAAFVIFCFYPCMPPRLLPKRFGFKDTVRQDHAESVWIGDGRNVNQLAAMPSLHFTYAFVIACTFFYHSGFLQRFTRRDTDRTRSQKPLVVEIIFLALAVVYPLLVLTVIVATANHYWLDAIVATFSVTLSFLCNRIWMFLLPAEDMLLWVLRLEKPIPTTGTAARSANERQADRRHRVASDEDALV